MLTKDIFSGMNILTLAGFVVMGLTLTLNRKGQTGRALNIGLMAAGTGMSRCLFLRSICAPYLCSQLGDLRARKGDLPRHSFGQLG